MRSRMKPTPPTPSRLGQGEIHVTTVHHLRECSHVQARLFPGFTRQRLVQ